MMTNTTFKKSNASIVWSIVAITVLAILYFETSTTKQVEYNVVILTDSKLVGANVFVDKREHEQVKKSEKLGSDNGIIFLNIPSGSHQLEIKDKSNTLLKNEITVDRKALINLKPKKK